MSSISANEAGRPRSRKGQFFSYDIVTALVILSLAFALVMFYWLSAQSSLADERPYINAHAVALADSLLTPGNPVAWTTGNVRQIGLTDGWGTNVINASKFGNLALLSYSDAKSRLRSLYDFNVTLINATNSSQVFHSAGASPSNARNLVVIERAVVYQDHPARLLLSLWSKKS
ncbi:MAG: hypothetical protein AB1468_05060 [Candidatus Micrarchaeota archaeon]